MPASMDLRALRRGVRRRQIQSAIIELGGGYRTADITGYFQKLGVPVPDVKTIRVDGASNHPSTPDGADGEVMLDIEVAAAIAPKARIAVYFAPNTDKGFLDAITMATHDTVNKPSVISISWGAAEKNWTGQALTSFDQAFQTAAALGITVCCAAIMGPGTARRTATPMWTFRHPARLRWAVEAPNSPPPETRSPVKRSGTRGPPAQRVGGVSDVFPVPTYQNTAGVPPSANAPTKRVAGFPTWLGTQTPPQGISFVSMDKSP